MGQIITQRRPNRFSLVFLATLKEEKVRYNAILGINSPVNVAPETFTINSIHMVNCHKLKQF
jgi:hypothetical protein